ncbi:MAG: efflux RND transporter periplasmic adaptor subunit [Kiritimatiellae bacterium]|nr:efflux RND transporter periplasmic adaptor subunit [Kiritimatiellia bacterium]MBR4476919.1 efflux RND transporter periplasmic adaptor subunit [Kiritimatiellia bacterium]
MRNAVVFAAAGLMLLAGCGEKTPLAAKKKGPSYRLAPIARTDVVRSVEATGTVTPRNSPSGIPVGAQVNGRLIKLFVDYNSVVTNGQVVALIDPLVYEANYKSAVARLHVSKANVEVGEASVKSREAELALAEKTYSRKRQLVDKALAPLAELDNAEQALATASAGLESAKASLKSAVASVEQAEAEVSQAEANLKYCTIVSPVDGIVIDRKVEEGETVVSSMNAVPVLTIAEDLKTVWVEATIPEADVGNIKVGQPVTFTADAYRRKFTGKVIQIRRAATTTNNVVTFPVIIEAENPDEMLFPGMTATLSIETARAEDVLVVAAAAFRFRPHDEDIADLGELPRGRKLWLLKDDGKIEPIVVTEGVSDDSFTEILADGVDALEGRSVVVGYQTVATAKQDETSNPFMPKFPKKQKGTAPEPKK